MLEAHYTSVPSSFCKKEKKKKGNPGTELNFLMKTELREKQRHICMSEQFPL